MKKESLQPRLAAFSRKLANLGPYSFFGSAGLSTGRNVRADPLVDVSTSELLTEIQKFPPPDPDDILLYTYVGHSIAFGDSSSDILLSYPADPQPRRSGTESLGNVLDIIFNHGFRKVVCILDCCHALHSRQTVRRFGGDYFTMFSASDGFARTAADGGVFIRTMMDALDVDLNTPIDQRFDMNRSGITLESLFKYVSSNLPEDREFLQQPTADGSLGHLLLRSFKRSLPSRLDTSTSQISVYRKIYAILQILGDEGQMAFAATPLEDLIRKAGKRPEFEARRLGDVPEPISSSRIQAIIDFMVQLGLLEYHVQGDNLVSRTSLGDEGSRKSEYSKVLREQIIERILPPGCTIEKLRVIISDLLSNGRPADENTIRVELADANIYVDDRDAFREGMRLLPYVGVFQKATMGTLFPGFENR
ncbi:MAG: hypothetical protein AAGG45_09820 [Pseudomonadota bacterium]